MSLLTISKRTRKKIFLPLVCPDGAVGYGAGTGAGTGAGAGAGET